VQAAVLLDDLRPGPQVQVEGVAEDDLAPSARTSSGRIALTVP
jgi:hypothetical protein